MAFVHLSTFIIDVGRQ